jgi:hypothetical protein
LNDLQSCSLKIALVLCLSTAECVMCDAGRQGF